MSLHQHIKMVASIDMVLFNSAFFIQRIFTCLHDMVWKYHIISIDKLVLCLVSSRGIYQPSSKCTVCAVLKLCGFENYLAFLSIQLVIVIPRCCDTMKQKKHKFAIFC